MKVVTPAARPRGFDLVLAVLTTAFAFLAASFAARNSDVYLHLAAGRLLAQGDYHFGVDPFSWAAPGVYWANHAWLFDLGLYLGYEHFGPPALVAVKALLVFCLAELLLRQASVPEKPFWVAAGCVVLGVLAMSPRLQLQPVCLSLLLLAGCLALLRTGGRAVLLLPVLIAVWVNVDGWFLLGPVVVGLFMLGQRRAERTPWWVMPACMLACLLSPHHVHALGLPAELSPAAWQSDFRQDPRFVHLFTSPWGLARAGGVNLSLGAYFVLLVLGAFSFALQPRALCDERFVVWLTFALLSAGLARAIPFFAVVAAPITARNLAERLPAGFLVRSGRAGLAAGCLALMALCWPGWLQGLRSGHGLAWTVVVDPSLQRATETLARWRREGALAEGARVVALHPDVCHYQAWFCPGEKGFVDSRLTLFVGAADDYTRLRRLLEGGSTPAETDLPRQHQITCAVLYDPDLRRLGPALRRAALSRECDLLRVDGRAVLVGFRGAAQPLPAGLRFSADRLASSGADDALPPASEEGVELTTAAVWPMAGLHRSTGATWQADAAAVFLHLFDDEAPVQQPRQRRRVLARYAAGLAGLPALSGGATALLGRLVGEGVFLPDLEERPPALPLLSVRAARTGLATHPDAGTWLVLAQAYLTLAQSTIEAAPHAELPLLIRVRQVQTATALVQATRLDPSLAAAHEALGLVYAERGFLDLALQHRAVQLRLLQNAPAGVDRERLAGLTRAVEQIRRSVQDAENRYFVRSQALAGDPLSRARLAVQLGLAGKAVDEVLLKSSPDLYGVPGVRLLLELLLLTGRAEEARLLLDRDEIRHNPVGLGWYDRPADTTPVAWGYPLLAYDWFDLCSRAAAGQYGLLANPAQRMRRRLTVPAGRNVAADVAWRLASEVGVGAAPTAGLLRFGRRLDRELAAAQLARGLFAADLHVLEGMLLLESGRVEPARSHLEHAVGLYRPLGRGAGLGLAQHYLQRLREGEGSTNRTQ